MIGGAPAYEALTAFAVDDGPVVLVNRGYAHRAGHPGTADRRAADRHGQHHRAAARLADRADRRPQAVHRGGLPAGLRHRHRSDRRAHQDPTDRFLPAAGGRPARWAGSVTAPQLDAGPFLSYGIQWIAFGIVAPARSRLFPLLRAADAPPGSRSPSRGRDLRRAGQCRGQAGRPVRTPALNATASTTAADCTSRDSHRTAQIRHPGPGRRRVRGGSPTGSGTGSARPTQLQRTGEGGLSHPPRSGSGGGRHRAARFALPRRRTSDRPGAGDHEHPGQPRR